MNKKGFAISGIVYSVLVLFLLLVFGILGILGSRKMVLDKLKNEVMNELNNEIASNLYKDKSGANYPRLADNMIPVLYDEKLNSWIYADVYEKWYDYDEKMWANAIVLKNGITKTVGQKIEEDEIALMYVWIPRYKYVIFNSNSEEIEEKQIEILFENGNNTTGTVKCVDAINQTDENGNKISEVCIDNVNETMIDNASTYTHPAFNFGEKEIYGFWVGKFENSTTDEICLNTPSVENCNKNSHMIEIKPNKNSLGYINISNVFTSIQNISLNYKINNSDSHMIKNMEWGAIAYLTNSEYGRCNNGTCEEITINNYLYQGNMTGCAANSINESQVTVCSNKYNTQSGVKASTTGNIYGVYDMSGGGWEQVMDNMVTIDGSFNPSKSGFTEAPLEMYYDKYTHFTTSNETTINALKLGTATKETKKWNNDINVSFSSTYPWMARGGTASSTNGAGIFAFDTADSFGQGEPSNIYSSRSILVTK